MFKKIGNAFRNFMLGRYGYDSLNKWLLIAGVAVILLSNLLRRAAPWANHLGLLAYVPLGFCMFRMYSRNIRARQKENKAFEGFFARLKDRQHRYYRCPGCRQAVRVPRGRGKINIRCPKCGMQFIKTT